MLKSFLICLFLAVLISRKRFLVKANECALNSECKLLNECPSIINNFALNVNKPYCNLNDRGTSVCCLKPTEKYTQEKDEDIRSIRECKLIQNHRASCEKSLIVSGDKAEPKEFPFMALLYYKNGNYNNYLCSGTLISNKYVLTAAHCFYVSNPPDWVRLGELDFSTTADDAEPEDYEIKNVITHPKYFTTDILEKYDDIALCELKSEVKFNNYIMPACLPLVDGREFTQYLTAGWGKENDSSTAMSTHLRKVQLDSFNQSTCASKVEQTDELKLGINNRTQMCAGSFKRDTCIGDGGSPLFVDHPDYKCLFLVLGITSFDQGSCSAIGLPVVYTRIQSYLDWIEQIVWKVPSRLLK